MNNPTKQRLLQQIAAITTMERGKLSTYSFQERPGASGPYYKLQHWEGGKNKTRYIPVDQVPALQAALSGYGQFRQLTEQYARLVIEETRQNMAALKKSKSPHPSSWPRKKKSNS
jgi:hypothetical protein